MARLKVLAAVVNDIALRHHRGDKDREGLPAADREGGSAREVVALQGRHTAADDFIARAYHHHCARGAAMEHGVRLVVRVVRVGDELRGAREVVEGRRVFMVERVGSSENG